jgi:hypothetical protein
VKGPETKDHIFYDSTDMKYPEIGKTKDTKLRLVVARDWWRGNRV